MPTERGQERHNPSGDFLTKKQRRQIKAAQKAAENAERMRQYELRRKLIIGGCAAAGILIVGGTGILVSQRTGYQTPDLTPLPQPDTFLGKIRNLERQIPKNDFDAFKDLSRETVALATTFACEQIASDSKGKFIYDPKQLASKFVLHTQRSFDDLVVNGACISAPSLEPDTVATHDLEQGVVHVNLGYVLKAQPDNPLELIASATFHELIHITPTPVPPITGEKAVVAKTNEVFNVAFHLGFDTYAVNLGNSRPGRSCLISFSYQLEEAGTQDYASRLAQRARIRSFIHPTYQRWIDRYRAGILEPYFPGQNGYLQALEYHQLTRDNDLFALIGRANDLQLSYYQAIARGRQYTDLLFLS